MKGNCMTGCKHCLVKDIYEKSEFKNEDGAVYATISEHVGYEYLCDGGHQEKYEKWHERNKDKTYEVYKKDFLDCFEPTEVTANLYEMIKLAKEILNAKK